MIGKQRLTGEGDCGPILMKAKIALRGTLSLRATALFRLNEYYVII